MPSANALRAILSETTAKLEKFQTKGDASAFQANVENAFLKEELKEEKAKTARVKDNANYLVNRLQIEQEESVPVILATGLVMSGVGTLVGMWGHGYMKTNYPDNNFAKAVTPLVGGAVVAATVILSEVSPEEKAKGVCPDYTTMAGGVGLGGGMVSGAAYQLYEDYKVANP